MALQNPEKANLPKDESLIPKNTNYCYVSNGTEIQGDKVIFKTIPCPFFDFDDAQNEQSDGYCHFLEKGDWMENGTFLLWDQCKECGINYEG
jgi:hypothetical protein